MAHSLQFAVACAELRFFEITATAGEGTGESFRRLPIEPRDLVLGDAGYWSAEGIAFVRKHRADVLVRVNPHNFVAYGLQGSREMLLSRLRALRQCGEMGEWKVVLRGENASVQGRLCAIRNSELAIGQAHRRLQRKASKMRTTLKPETLEYAKYVIVFTTLAAESAGEVLECYRLRWQIELAFKRMKTLAHLGHLPKHDKRSARAWLYGKLLAALLTQKLIWAGRDISPWGYSLPVAPSDQPVA